MYKILVCDDDRDIVSALEIYLKAEGYQVEKAYNGQEALACVEREEIHLVLMDIMMPGLDGISATIQLRRASNVPVILITAKSEDTDKVLGLNLGADDYITKPFNPVEVMARVRSQLRRYAQLGGMEQKPTVLQIGGIRLDDEAKAVTLDGDPVALTPSNTASCGCSCPTQARYSAPAASTSWCGRTAPLGRKGLWRCISAT